MKILLSLIGSTIGTTGGVEKVLCNMANAMVERGHEVTILTFEDKEGKPFFKLDERVNFLNLGIGHKLNHFWFNITSFYLNKDRKEVKRLMNDCQKIADVINNRVSDIHADVLITFEQRSEVIFKKFNNLNIPIITMFHFDYNTVLRNKLLHYLYEKSNCLQVLTKNDLVATKKLIKNTDIVCIPNAVPQSEKQAQLDVKKIITVGRIDPKQKRQDLLIEAFKIVSEKHSEWKLDIYGDTSFNKNYYNECIELIKKYKLEDKVEFCGITKDVEGVLLNSSIFAFPSAYEGFPLALTEALALGLPSVGYRSCSGTNEVIIDGESGFLCNDGVEYFANALDKLMDDDDLRLKMGAAAKNSMKLYAPDNIWDMWEELMDKELKNS